MIRINYRSMAKTVRYLKQKSGKSIPWLIYDMAKCAILYGAGYMDYKIAQMYRLNRLQRASVITRGISNHIVSQMNDKRFWCFFDDKSEFNAFFSRYIKRDWVALNADFSTDNVMAFLQSHDQCIVKPLHGSSGKGIHFYRKNDWAGQPLDFIDSIAKNGSVIIEEVITQHPTLHEVYPHSVNTIRIATLLGEKKQGIVYAFLRIGNGQKVDNVDCGGMAARVDLESGVVTTVGADKQGNVFTHHPLTHHKLPGLVIPYWQESISMCIEASQVIPQMRYIAWDVAITAKGPVMIEGNSFPSHAVPQFYNHYSNGMGILQEFEEFINIR